MIVTRKGLMLQPSDAVDTIGLKTDKMRKGDPTNVLKDLYQQTCRGRLSNRRNGQLVLEHSFLRGHGCKNPKAFSCGASLEFCMLRHSIGLELQTQAFI
jgi:hypothetical protein